MPRKRKTPVSAGRMVNVKNLRYTDDLIINQNNVEITREEARIFKNEIDKINKRHKRMWEKEQKRKRLSGAKETGDNINSLRLMDKEFELIIAKRSKSLQRFTSREQFLNALENAKKVNEPGYIDQRVNDYKENYIKALKNTYNSNADDLIKTVQEMPNDKFMKTINQNEDLEIKEVYPMAQEDEIDHLNKLRDTMYSYIEAYDQMQAIVKAKKKANRKKKKKKKR